MHNTASRFWQRNTDCLFGYFSTFFEQAYFGCVASNCTKTIWFLNCKGSGRKQSYLILICYPTNYLENWRKPLKTCQDSPDHDFQQEGQPHDCKVWWQLRVTVYTDVSGQQSFLSISGRRRNRACETQCFYRMHTCKLSFVCKNDVKRRLEWRKSAHRFFFYFYECKAQYSFVEGCHKTELTRKRRKTFNLHVVFWIISLCH
jgi:hypothetical protein